MKKEKKKKTIFFTAGIIVGLLISCGGVYAATYINAVNVGYSNSSSGLSSTNMQDALDEAYKKTELKNKDNIVEAYTYNSSSCVTGNESTCVKSTCYKSTTAGSCPAGTIIRYKVSATEVITFHVMYDNGTTMTMQSQKNTVYSVPWSTTSFSASSGPIAAIEALERATAGWTNVNNQTYAAGSTVFKTNAYTHCSAYNSCTSNLYTLDKRTAKARMITIQEAVNLGCTSTSGSCPTWMINYTSHSTNSGGTINDTSTALGTGNNNGYWTMNSYLDNYAWCIHYNSIEDTYLTSIGEGIRAVIVVSK